MRAADLSAVMQAHRARIEGIELAHSDRMEHLEARHKVELEQAAARHAAASAAQASLGWSFTGLTSEYDQDMASDDRFCCTQGLSWLAESVMASQARTSLQLLATPLLHGA